MADSAEAEPTSRVAARRKAREQAAADEAKGAVGGAGSKPNSKSKAKGGRFANRNTREKRRGTGVVTLQEDDLDKSEEVKKATSYNEEIGRQPTDQCGNGATNGATECGNGATNGAADVCSNGTTETKESPRHRRQDKTNSDETESHHNARRRIPVEDEPSSPYSTPTSILRRAEARASTDGRSPEEWRRMYEREHRDNRRLQRRIADMDKNIDSLKDELYLVTEELETAEDELDSVREENRVLLKALGDKDS